MGDDEGKSAEQVGLKSDSNGLTEVLPTQPSSVDQSLPAGIVGTPFKVLNGASQALSVGDVVLPIDGEDSKLSGISVEENGKTKKPLSGLRTINGAVISFCDVGYSVEVRTRSRGCTCRTNSQFILKNVSGIFRPALNVIMGPTGSGKTTLLDLLAGRKELSACIGKVLVDEKKQPRNFKCMSGYVIQVNRNKTWKQQSSSQLFNVTLVSELASSWTSISEMLMDDIVMGMLTVRENIEFSAALRLPSSTSAEQRRERVDEIISDLGLSRCASTRVGTEFVRGISGGERKRTNIAMELITLPRVLFLDEPTTGLDANTAYSVMLLLKRLSLRGMTVILSIHQPRYSIYKLFDTLTLMGQGRSIYHGPADEALTFFTSNNYMCEEHNNPADFFLDVLNGSIRSATTAPLNETENEFLKEEDLSAGLLSETEDTETAEERVENIVTLYQKSKWHKKLEDDLQCLRKQFDCSEGELKRVRAVEYPTNFFTQMCSAIILGLIVGAIYFQVGMSYKSGIQNRVGAFFFIVMNYVFGNMSAVDIFIKERAVFIHETVSGYYRVSVYFLAKLFCDVAPQRVLPILLFASISYFMIGFQLGIMHFSFYVLNTILTSLAGTSVALVFSATTRQHTIGTVLTALVWVCMMVFSGTLVNVSTVPSFLQWLKWFSIFQYSMNAFEVNELKGLVFADQSLNGTEMIEGSLHRDTGDDYLTRQGIPHETAWDLWRNELALILIGLGFLVLTYIQLRRTKTVK